MFISQKINLQLINYIHLYVVELKKTVTKLKKNTLAGLVINRYFGVFIF